MTSKGSDQSARIPPPPPPPPPGKLVSTQGNGFNLSKCFIYLGKLSWCAGVCDGTGKIEVKIGGSLVF